jgi:hypothetical protein
MKMYPVKKTISILTMAAVTAMTTLAAKAALVTPTNASLGDIFLGVESSSKNYVIDLGNAASVLGGKNFNLNADLVSAFGSSFATTVTQYSIFGMDQLDGSASPVINQSHIFVSDISPTYNFSKSTSVAGLATTASDYASWVQAYNTYVSAKSYNSAANSYGVAFSSGDSGAWGSYTGKSPFWDWKTLSPNNALITSFGGNDYIAWETVGANSPSSIYQTFSLSTTGNLTLGAVPEPSTWAMVIVSGFVLAVFVYRKNNKCPVA